MLNIKYVSIYALVVRSTHLQVKGIKTSIRCYVSKKHPQTHREEWTLACDVCKKLFKSASALKLHVCSYTKEKSFTGGVFNKTFMISNNFFFIISNQKTSRYTVFYRLMCCFRFGVCVGGVQRRVLSGCYQKSVSI